MVEGLWLIRCLQMLEWCLPLQLLHWANDRQFLQIWCCLRHMKQHPVVQRIRFFCSVYDSHHLAVVIRGVSIVAIGTINLWRSTSNNMAVRGTLAADSFRGCRLRGNALAECSRTSTFLWKTCVINCKSHSLSFGSWLTISRNSISSLYYLSGWMTEELAGTPRALSPLTL